MSEMTERVARAICKARGFDPDQMIYMTKETPFGAGGFKMVEHAPTVPSWTVYVHDAQAAIDAICIPYIETVFGSDAMEAKP